MNKILSIVVLVAISTFAFSCSNDYYVPNADVKGTFKSMYPKAAFVDWEQELGYAKADFRLDGKEKDAWFETSGTWLMTETDLRAKDIPAAINAAIKKTDYAAWKIDDVDFLEYADSSQVYVIDVEKGESDVELYFSPDGTLLKTVTDDTKPYHLP